MFVRALAGASTATECGVAPSCFDHIVMNLPASAVEFLGAPSAGSPLRQSDSHSERAISARSTQMHSQAPSLRTCGKIVHYRWCIATPFFATLRLRRT